MYVITVRCHFGPGVALRDQNCFHKIIRKDTGITVRVLVQRSEVEFD
jgi:hypothetical protein